MNSSFADKKELEKFGIRIVSVCKRLYGRNLITSLGGNISARTSDPYLLLCSPSGMPLAEMLPGDLCLVSLKPVKDPYIEISPGSNVSIKPINHTTAFAAKKDNNLNHSDNFSVISGKYEPTSEILIHSAVYCMRPEIKAIIHAHPPYVTALSCLDEKINFNLTEDRNYYIGNIAALPFIPGGSPKLAESVIAIAPHNNAIICANHGIFVFGNSLAEAVNITELVEELAKIFFISRMAGHVGSREIKAAVPDGISEDYDSLKSSFIYRDEIFDP